MESLRSSGDFNDLLASLNAEAVKYLVVGGFALAAYGRSRYTKDLDVWIDPAGDNPERVFRALVTFGAALEGVTPDDFRDPDCIFQIGVEPLRIGILNDISGLTFADAWPNRHESFYGSTPVFIISRDDLITNKRASGRPRDLRDIASLEDDS